MHQGYEPIFHSSNDDHLWINEIMSNLGFYYGSIMDRVVAFNAYLKNYANTQWAYSCFIAYNPPNENAPDRFTNNYFAYAYQGGPYIQMLYKNDNWALDDTWGSFAHETGHIFWACDEYYEEGYGGCTSCAPCNNYRPVYNGNCEHPSCNPNNGVPCIMRHQGNAVCTYTAQQVGWNVSQYQLEDISGAGGTTIPSPGFYTYSGGDEVTVEAIPETYNCFYKWGEAYQGNENPIVITMNANKKIFADFRYINEPIGLSGEKVLNRSLSQAEYINILKWQANPKNYEITISKYRIFQVHNEERNPVVELDSNIFEYRHRKVQGNIAYIYEIVAINSDGREGRPARIFIE